MYTQEDIIYYIHLEISMTWLGFCLAYNDKQACVRLYFLVLSQNSQNHKIYSHVDNAMPQHQQQ